MCDTENMKKKLHVKGKAMTKPPVPPKGKPKLKPKGKVRRGG